MARHLTRVMQTERPTDPIGAFRANHPFESRFRIDTRRRSNEQ